MTQSTKFEPVRVALDTEIFVREQYDFLRSHRLKGLIDRVKQGYLQLFITDITDREVRAGITKRVTESVSYLQNKKQTRILRNTTLFKGLPAIADSSNAAAELHAQFAWFCTEASVEVISSRHVNVAMIMDAYFNELAPFNNREAKKHEFPDAVTVAALGEWASARKLELIVVSNDAGVRQACEPNPFLDPVEQTEEVLNRITERVATMALVTKAREQFKIVRKELRSHIEEAFESLGFYVSDDQFEESHVASVNVNKVRITDLALTDVDEETAVFDMTAVVDYSAEVSFDDPDMIVYAEGDRYSFNTISGETAATEEISVTATIGLDQAVPAAPDLINVELHVTDIDVPMDEFVRDQSDSSPEDDEYYPE